MKIQESAENYLETILMLKEEKGAVRSIDIARKMDFSKPSISRAMSLLRENGYITMDKEGLIDLTDAGMEIASRIYERHRLLSKWLRTPAVLSTMCRTRPSRRLRSILPGGFWRNKRTAFTPGLPAGGIFVPHSGGKGAAA